MSDKKDNSYEKEFKKTTGFEKRTGEIVELYNTVVDLLQETTNAVFKKAGYDEIETPTSVYANGKPYGFGAEEGKFKVRIASKTSSSIEKQIILGAKKMEAEIAMSYANGIFSLVYKTTEQDIYKHYMISEKLIMPTKDMAEIKKELKKLFTKTAEKELGYLTNTKLGVEDKTETSIRPIVSINENKNKMSKLTLKDLFSDSQEENKEKINESIEDMESTDDSKNIDKVIDLNTVPLEGEKKKHLLFDDEEEGMEDDGAIFEKYSNVNKEEISKIFKDTLKSKFGSSSFKSLTPVEKKELFNTIDALVKSKEEGSIEEITTAGPAGAGAGRYDATSAWAPVGMLKNKGEKTGTSKKDKVSAGAPYTIAANSGMYEGEEKKDLAKKIIEERQSQFNNTNYAKTKNSKRPKVDQDYNVIPQVKKESFYTPVVLNPGSGYVPKGMEHNYIAGQHSKNTESGSYVGDADAGKKVGPIKRKFATIKENEEKGINKRYIITEKTTDEYEKERWEKLSGFKTYESIMKFEEDLINDKVDINEDFNPSSYESDSKSDEDNLDAEINEFLNENEDSSKETVLVEKPGSTFGLCYKFYKEDFINENKTYLLDLNSRVFVANPNFKK